VALFIYKKKTMVDSVNATTTTSSETTQITQHYNDSTENKAYPLCHRFTGNTGKRKLFMYTHTRDGVVFGQAVLLAKNAIKQKVNG